MWSGYGAMSAFSGVEVTADVWVFQAELWRLLQAWSMPVALLALVQKFELGSGVPAWNHL